MILPGWDVFQWPVKALELGQQLFLQLVYLSSGRWAFEQPHEWVPLLILALVPSGRVWGVDRRLAHGGLRRFGGRPF